MAPTLWTIGHSTRPFEEFLALLRAYDIERLVDVRRFPASRRHPAYNAASLHRSLPDAGLRYELLPDLGGRRPSRADSPNTGWRNASFRGYADHMQTEAFWRALANLLAPAPRTAILCAEAVPWRCHRSLIADAVLTQGWEVCHILSRTSSTAHALTPFAHVVDGRLLYPPIDAARSPTRLF